MTRRLSSSLKSQQGVKVLDHQTPRRSLDEILYEMGYKNPSQCIKKLPEMMTELRKAENTLVDTLNEISDEDRKQKVLLTVISLRALRFDLEE